jgi:iron(III) transport system ATP-binding protein
MVARFYLGDAVDYRVQCGENLIRVIVKGADVDAYPDGSTVYLDFDKTMVFSKD